MSRESALYCEKCHESIGADKYSDFTRNKKKPLMLAKFIEFHIDNCSPTKFFVAAPNEFYPELKTEF